MNILFLFTIIIASYSVYKFSCYFLIKINLQMEDLLYTESFSYGFITRKMLAYLSRNYYDSFCRFFLMNEGFREIQDIELSMMNSTSYIAVKDDIPFIIMCFTFNKEESSLSVDTLNEIIGILSHRKIYNSVIICDYCSDIMDKINLIDNYNIQLYDPLNICDFFWHNNNFFKEVH